MRATQSPPTAFEDSWRVSLDSVELAGVLKALGVAGHPVANEPRTIDTLVFDLWRLLRLHDAGLSLDTFRQLQQEGAPALVLIELAPLLATIPEGKAS
jgi:hypothetical protein